MECKQSTCLKRLRRPADDIVPFFAAAALMVIIARLLLGEQNPAGVAGQGGQALGLANLHTAFTDYAFAMAILGPPMVLAFIAQWSRHGMAGEHAAGWGALLLGALLWSPLAHQQAFFAAYGPSFLAASGAGQVQALVLMTIGWAVWQGVREALTRLRPLPVTLALWRGAWALILVPTVFFMAHFTVGALVSVIPGLGDGLVMAFDWRQPDHAGHALALALYLMLAMGLAFYGVFGLSRRP